PPDFAASLSALHVRSLPTRRSADLDREGVDHALVQRVQPPGETAEDRDDNADDDDDQQGNLCSAHRPLRRLPMSRRAMPGVCGIDRKSTRLNSSHASSSYAAFSLTK